MRRMINIRSHLLFVKVYKSIPNKRQVVRRTLDFIGHLLFMMSTDRFQIKAGYAAYVGFYTLYAVHDGLQINTQWKAGSAAYVGFYRSSAVYDILQIEFPIEANCAAYVLFYRSFAVHCGLQINSRLRRLYGIRRML